MTIQEGGGASGGEGPGPREWRDERVDAFRARLDRISADIKGLEQYLANGCAFVEVTYPLGDSFPGEDIVWKRCEPDRWRLVYRKRKDDERPLMESKVEVRIAAIRALPGLLARVGDVIGAINEHAAAHPPKETT